VSSSELSTEMGLFVVASAGEAWTFGVVLGSFFLGVLRMHGWEKTMFCCLSLNSFWWASYRGLFSSLCWVHIHEWVEHPLFRQVYLFFLLNFLTEHWFIWCAFFSLSFLRVYLGLRHRVHMPMVLMTLSLSSIFMGAHCGQWVG
jgi:hypothetical protein